MKKKIEPGICLKCGEKISKKENFVSLTQYERGLFLKEGWYHTTCFREGVHGTIQQREITKKANMFLDKALNMVGGPY